MRDTEGLTYQLYSRFAGSDALDGVWFANVNVAPQNVAQGAAVDREEIAHYAREGATDAEVAAQKSFFAGNFQVGLGSNAGVAAALVTAEKFGFGPRYLDEFPARIKAVTTAQANAAMRKHFFADRLNLIVAGDLGALTGLTEHGSSPLPGSSPPRRPGPGARVPLVSLVPLAGTAASLSAPPATAQEFPNPAGDDRYKPSVGQPARTSCGCRRRTSW